MAEGGAGDEDGDEEHVAGQGPSAMEEDECCWICLEAGSRHDLVNPCRCPRKCHPQCMARWQLQQAGRAEETHCRFCNSALADWKASLTPETLKPEVEKVQPVMVVYFEGEIHRIPVRQGKEGLDVFTDRIRELFRLPEDVDISLTFGCKEPMSGQHLKLEGIGAFDAAVHCASVAAAERQHKIRSNGGGSSGAAGGSSAAGAEAAGGPSSSGSPNSSSASDCSAGGNVLGGSAPVTSTSSPTASRGGNHVGTMPLRHSTGSTPWVPASGSSSTAAASTGLGAVAGASRLLRAVGQDLMEQDDDDGGDTPSPFMQGVPAWQGAYPPALGAAAPPLPAATALPLPLRADERALLQQHLLPHASASAPQPHRAAVLHHYHFPHLYPDPRHAPHCHHRHFVDPSAISLATLHGLAPLPPAASSTDLLAPGTPSARGEAGLRLASPLPSLPLAHSELLSRVSSVMTRGSTTQYCPFTQPHAASSSPVAIPSTQQQQQRHQQHSGARSSPFAPAEGSDLQPRSPSAPAYGRMPAVAAAAARRARRSTLQYAEVPVAPAPDVAQQQQQQQQQPLQPQQSSDADADANVMCDEDEQQGRGGHGNGSRQSLSFKGMKSMLKRTAQAGFQHVCHGFSAVRHDGPVAAATSAALDLRPRS